MDSFYFNGRLKIAIIPKRLDKKFCTEVCLLHFLPKLKGEVVPALLIDVRPSFDHSTPCGFFKEPEKVFQMKNLKYVCIADFDKWAVVFPLVISGYKAFRNLRFLLSFHLWFQKCVLFKCLDWAT